MEELQGRDVIGDTFEEVLLRKNSAVVELERVLLMEETSWQQNYRFLWLKEGDKCTVFP